MTGPRVTCGLILCFAALATTGCLTIKAPEEVSVTTSRDYRGEDSAYADRRMPQTRSHDECRDALHQSYEEISALQRQIAWRDRQIRKLQDDVREAKKDRDKYKDRYEGAKRSRD